MRRRRDCCAGTPAYWARPGSAERAASTRRGCGERAVRDPSLWPRVHGCPGAAAQDGHTTVRGSITAISVIPAAVGRQKFACAIVGSVMPRASKTGIRGYFVDSDGRRRIDLRYRDSAGRPQRYKETFPPGTPARAAELKAREVLAAAIRGELAKRDNESPLTLGDAFDRYLEWCETNGRGDPEYKRRHREHWVATLGEGFPLADLSELTIERHKKRRRTEGKANGTINRELVTVKHFLNRCVDWGWIDKRPKVVLLPEPPPRVRWLSDDERKRLATALAKPQRKAFRRLVNAALLSGLRLSNLITLTRDQIDLGNATIALPDTKPGKRHHVPISDALADVLREAMAASEGSPHVFVAGRKRDGKHVPYTRNGASSFFRRVVDDAGIADFHMHDLRHTFATEVRQAGHGLDVVQALLGHASPAMTQRYAHLGEATLKRAVAAVAPVLPPEAAVAPRKRQKRSRGSSQQRAS